MNVSTDWKKILEQIINKESEVARRNRNKIPYTTVDAHVFDDRSDKDNICWWTNGFWGGILWQLYDATGEGSFKDIAVEVENKLDAVIMNYNGMDHDAGFRWLPTSVINYRLTGDEKAKNRGLLAASSLAGRFNINGGFIRAWNDFNDGRDTRGWAIIDCMMNLPLLYWASDELDDPRFRAIATEHADTTQKCFIRSDGSVCHIAGFDPETGMFLQEHGGQGIGEGSSWTRGQTWALYGFALSFLHTGKESYLDTAVKVADRFISRIPDDYLIPVDFDQADDCEWRDATAAAIASSGLLTLAKILKGETSREGLHTATFDRQDGERAKRYQEAARRMLCAIDEHDADYDPSHDELLTRCTAAYHDREHNFPIIYGDYFYIEAIRKLADKDLFIW